jgi:hypothetical protein
VVSTGVVVAVNVVDAGSNYTNTPVIIIAPPFVPQPVVRITTLHSLNFTNLIKGTNYQLQLFSAGSWSNLGTIFTAADSMITNYVLSTDAGDSYRLTPTPVPRQAQAIAELVNGFMVGATLTDAGSGYDTSPLVNIIGGGGANAGAVTVVSEGIVTEIIVTNAGIGYTNDPSILIAPPPAPAATLWPFVTPVMKLDTGPLTPYDNYQLEFSPIVNGRWSDFGVTFTSTSTTSTQYFNQTNQVGFFRLRHLP